MSEPDEHGFTDEEYIQIAWDYYGSAIRDNSVEEKVFFGKQIELDGHDPNEAGCDCCHCQPYKAKGE